MNSTRQKRLLLISSAIILLCITIIIGMSYALFSDSERITNHLQAGNLDITLERTWLKSTYLTDRGFLDTTTNTTIKDFTNNKNENVFDLEGKLIVPLSEYTANMRITNNSKTAFSYWVEIVYKGDANVDLADQITLTVTRGNDKLIDLEKNLLVSKTINTLAVGDVDEFQVSVKFNDRADNNLAMNDSVYFDLVVHAIQETQDPLATK